MRVLPATADIFLLILLLLAFFGALGVILFSRVDGLKTAFGSLGSGLISLCILLTTANFPDIMLKVYKLSAASCFFFVLFLFLGVFVLINLMLVAVVRNYEIQMRAAEATARHRRNCALEAAFTLLDLNSNGFVNLVELSSLLQRVSQPVFSLFDGEMSRALDTAHTMHALQRMLEGDAALPVRGIGPAAFRECILTLQNDHSLTQHVGEQHSDDSDDDEDADEELEPTSAEPSPQPTPPLPPTAFPPEEPPEPPGPYAEVSSTAEGGGDGADGGGDGGGGGGLEGPRGGSRNANAEEESGGESVRTEASDDVGVTFRQLAAQAGAAADNDGAGMGLGAGLGAAGGSPWRAGRGGKPLPDPRCASLESLPDFLLASPPRESLSASADMAPVAEGGESSGARREVHWSGGVDATPSSRQRRESYERRHVVVVETEDGTTATIGAPLPSPHLGESRAFRQFRRFVKSRRLDQVVDALLVLNMAVRPLPAPRPPSPRGNLAGLHSGHSPPSSVSFAGASLGGGAARQGRVGRAARRRGRDRAALLARLPRRMRRQAERPRLLEVLSAARQLVRAHRGGPHLHC